jgi:hypothetical protein
MKRLLLSGVVAIFCITNSFAQEAGKVERKGTAGKVKQEEVVSGYLTDLNGNTNYVSRKIPLNPEAM